MTISSTNPVRLNGKSVPRKQAQTQSPPSNINHSSKFIIKSNSSEGTTPSKLISQNKLPQAPTPTGVRRATSIRETGSNRRTTPSLQAQTPILKLTREIKSRLPRVTPTPVRQAGGNLFNSDTRKIRSKKPLNHDSKTSTLTTTSTSSPFIPSSLKSPSISECQTLSKNSIDPDLTPRKLPPGPTSKAENDTTVDGNGISQQEELAKAPNHQIEFNSTSSTTVPDLTPKRPMTRARSKHLFKLSTSSSQASSSSQILTTGIPVPQVTRKSSRVVEIAQAFQSKPSEKFHRTQNSTAKLNEPTSHNLLRVTPDRRRSDSSTSSFVSPPGSIISNSPNLSALAASLSKQFVKTDRSRKGRPSITDMLRYSTMSTLGELHWEDGADEVLLTDPNETEAMVADISMTKVTPLKSEVQSAAIALASARENFLSLVQENGEPIGEAGRVQAILKDLSPPNQFGTLKRGTSAYNNNVSSPLSTPRISSISRHSSSNRSIAHEAQLASLSALLEKSRQRETELENEVKRLLSKEDKSIHTKSNVAIKQEREKSLEEEIKRLENELDECKEANIELENSLDLIKFENQENLNKVQSLLSHQEWRSSLLPLPSSSKLIQGETTSKQMNDLANQKDNNPSKFNTTSSSMKFEKFNEFDKALMNDINFIKESLETLSVMKISLALSAHLFSDESNQTKL